VGARLAGRYMVDTAANKRVDDNLDLPARVERRVLAARGHRHHGTVVLAAGLNLNASTVGRVLHRARTWLTPDTNGVSFLAFHQIDRAREAGRLAGSAVVQALADWCVATFGRAARPGIERFGRGRNGAAGAKGNGGARTGL